MEENVEFSGLTLKFNEEYCDFPDFMEATREPIYRCIIHAFNTLKNVAVVEMTVKSNIDGKEFDTLFEYTKENIDVLIDVITPYYESIEDYETCAEIRDLYNELKQ